MSRKIFLISLFVLIFLCLGCSKLVQKPNEGKIQDLNSPNQNIQLQQTVNQNVYQNSLYQISIPTNWTGNLAPGNAMTFTMGGKEIGGVNSPISFDPNLKINNLIPVNLIPNHSKPIKIEKLDGFPTEVFRVILEKQPPAASGSTEIKQEIHYYFLIADKNIAFDLFFNLHDVSEEDATKVSKTFKIL